MATSMSKAQSSLSCQLCSIQRVIKWKCTECDLLMCDICKTNVHSRIKTAETHNIITIQEVGTDLSERLKALHIPDVFSSVFNSYATDLPGIHKLISRSEDIIYCMNNADDRVYHFIKAKLLKASMKTVQKYDISCVDFAISYKEEILFSPMPGTKLKATMTTTKQTNTVLDTSPMLILGIHISKQGELLLGLRDQGTMFPVTEFSTRQVAVFGTDYKHRSTFERDGTGKRLFNYARRIITDSESNIYVVDSFDNDKRIGSIISIDRNGHKRFLYKGCTSFNTHDVAFNPMDIAVTSNDTVIISDSSNHALHALSAKGELIGLQITKNLDICYPYSLNIDNEGFLLLSTNTKDINQIFILKLIS